MEIMQAPPHINLQGVVCLEKEKGEEGVQLGWSENIAQLKSWNISRFS
jgi:hypothetical protein